MLRITAGGDALFVRPFPKEYSEKNRITELINRGDVRIVNLETTITDGSCHGSAYSGGTWVTARPEVLEELSGLGFNYFALANNHTMDYSYEGLESTLAALDELGLAYSGAGNDLAEATRPAILKTENGSVGIISACSTFNMAAAAGAATPYMPGRPGLNPLGFSTLYSIPGDELEALKRIESEVNVNGLKNLHREQGFETKLPEGVYEFGGNMFRACAGGEQPSRRTHCVQKDLDRICNEVKACRKVCDYAVVIIHSHEVKAQCDEEADYFVEEFAHACIDAGASAVIGGGTHQLKGIEIYKGAPIFYSLGNFIFQNSLVEKLPAEFMEKYGLPLDTAAPEAILARSRTASRSLASSTPCYRSVLPEMCLDEEGCRELQLHVIELGQDRRDDEKNLPHPADETVVAEVCEYLKRVSAQYGTGFILEKDGIRVVMEKYDEQQLNK